MRRLLILAALTALSGAQPAAAKCSIAKVAELPVTMAGLRPLVAVKVNGQDTMLMADSGAFYSILTPQAAKRLGLKVEAMPFGYRLSGATGDLSTGVTKVKAFGIGPSTVPNIEFLVAGGEIGAEAAGVLGQNVLGAFDVEYDLANGVIRLFKTRDCGKTMLAYWAGQAPVSIVDIRKTSAADPHIIAPVLLNGVRLQALFDTGAPTSVLTLSGARRAGIRPDSPGVTPTGQSGGLGRQLVDNWIGLFDSIEIGGIKVLRTKLRFGAVQLGEADMLLGDDFFLSTRVFISYANSRMFFTYNGGSMFAMSGRRLAASAASGAAQSPLTPAADMPTDAAGFARRGAAFLARGDVDDAFKDLSHATGLAPDDGRIRFQLAQALLQKGDPPAAVKELDTAVRLRPDDPEIRLSRSFMRRQADDREGARADLDAAAAATAPQADLKLQIANLYVDLDDFAPAVAQLNHWIAHHREDSKYPQALNTRCWARALGAFELPAALRDCDTAVRLTARSPDVLDSRGLVRLRLGQYAQAVADYDAVLAREPDVAWSRYGRGVAKLKLGQRAEGEADIAAAAKLDAKLAARAAKLGITP